MSMSWKEKKGKQEEESGERERKGNDKEKEKNETKESWQLNVVCDLWLDPGLGRSK